MADVFRDPIDAAEDLVAARVRAWSDRAVTPIDAAAIARGALAGGRGRPAPALSGRAARRLGLILVIAGVGLGAAFLAGSQGPAPQPTPSPSPSPSPSAPLVPMGFLPADIPADLPTGVVDTPFGSARWVHLSGTAATLPGPLRPVPGPIGLLWFHPGGTGPIACPDTGALECLSKPQLWASADAISTRTERSLPVAAAQADLRQLGDTWWLISDDPVSLWSSTDAERWTEVDIGTLAPPGPAGLTWDADLGLPAGAGGTAVVPVTSRALDAGRLLGQPERAWYVWPEPLDGDRYRVMDGSEGGGDTPVGEVRIEPTADGLRFSDPTTGSMFGDLAGVDMAFIEAWSANQAIVDHRLIVVDGGSASLVTLPGPPLFDPWGMLGPTVFRSSSGFLAYLSTPDGTIRTWRSSDGHDWAEGELLGDDEGEPRDAFRIRVHGGPGEPSTVLVSNPEQGRYWTSEDGLTWTVGPVAPDSSLVPLRIPGGWLVWVEGIWWASLDGETWQRANELERLLVPTMTMGGGSAGPTGVIGHTLFYAVDEVDLDERDLWIVEFEADP